MRVDKYRFLACPLDGLDLVLQAKTLKCPQGHSYDLARQGYVNLLAVQQKKSRAPGDSKEMIDARKRFLNAGFYTPIASYLAQLSAQYLPQNTSVACLDAGCGEGYYLTFFHGYLEQQKRRDVHLYGLDISKAAIIAATQRQQAITWVVGNSQHAPVTASSMDMIWSVFGFHHLQGFKHMLAEHGKLLMVEAGPQHLIELRKIIYPHIKSAEPGSLDEYHEAGWRLVDSQKLTYQTAPLANEQLADLLLMTPHLFRASKAGKQAAAKLDNMVLTVDVTFQVFETV